MKVVAFLLLFLLRHPFLELHRFQGKGTAQLLVECLANVVVCDVDILLEG